MNWCRKLEDFDVPNKIQPRENSKGGGVDGFLLENELVCFARSACSGAVAVGAWMRALLSFRSGGTWAARSSPAIPDLFSFESLNFNSLILWNFDPSRFLRKLWRVFSLRFFLI